MHAKCHVNADEICHKAFDHTDGFEHTATNRQASRSCAMFVHGWIYMAGLCDIMVRAGAASIEGQLGGDAPPSGEQPFVGPWSEATG